MELIYDWITIVRQERKSSADGFFDELETKGQEKARLLNNAIL
jgi:hypothetical protein